MRRDIMRWNSIIRYSHRKYSYLVNLHHTPVTFTTVILILLMILLLFGCTNPTEVTMKDLRAGTNGIVLKFLDGQPPAKVYENDRFVMTLELHNDGAATAKNAILSFGAPKEYVSVDIAGVTLDGKSTSMHFDIEGKSLKNPNGDINVLIVPVQAKTITTSKRQEVTAQAQLCYDYQTLAEASACVNYDPRGYLLSITACKPQKISMSSQGAPIAVAQVDVQSKYLPDGSLGSVFIITLQNRGNGKVIEAGHSKEACSGTEDVGSLWDKVRVTAVLGGRQIQCKKEVVRLENNKAEVFCEGSLQQTAGPYMAPLQVYVDYGYTQTLSKQFVIERIS